MFSIIMQTCLKKNMYAHSMHTSKWPQDIANKF